MAQAGLIEKTPGGTKRKQSLIGKREAGLSALTSKGNPPKGSSRLIFL